MINTLIKFLLLCAAFSSTVGAKPNSALSSLDYNHPERESKNCITKIRANTLVASVPECEWVDLRGAQLRGAFMYGIKLRGATLRRAILTGANLRYAILVGANLRYVEMAGANLNYANLSYANLRQANLLGANLLGANLTNTYIDGALYNTKTVWPKGFDPKAAGAVLVR